MKASLELAFRLPRSQSPAGNARLRGSASRTSGSTSWNSGQKIGNGFMWKLD
ncbi:hypothetical protein [uncultured Nostoc sp.]|uniref:hypothetical protein n=1 Tax=uncultured Nostoc sp. TaxID=340711 RepID=UPI0035C9DF00